MTDKVDASRGRRRFCVVYNPVAGQRRGSLYRRTVALLEERRCEVVIRPTAGPGDAVRLAKLAAREEFDAVVAAGGDGTINEVVNGMLGSDMPLGIVPLGTANVFAAEIGLSVEAPEIVGALLTGWAVSLHVGRANGRAFGLMAGVGHDAHVVRDVDVALKRRIGKGAYVVAAFSQILHGSPVLYDVVADGTTYRAASVVVANGHYYGGRFVCAPAARLTSPTFEVCLAERPGRWNTLRYAAGLVLGTLPKLAGYRIVTASNIRISGPAGDPVQGDGDTLTSLPVDIDMAPKPLNLIVPRDSPVLDG